VPSASGSTKRIEPLAETSGRSSGSSHSAALPGVTNPVTVESQNTLACDRVCDWTSNTPLSCMARSSGQVTNPGEPMRAGIAKMMARRFICRKSGNATDEALDHPSSNVSATALGPGSTPSTTRRAISSHVTVR
jgi:hypothetical protein